MVVTNKTELPKEEELTVQEINLSTPYLLASAFHLGVACQAQNNEFMLCRSEEKDPRKCIKEGKAVTACALNFFQTLKKSCSQEITQYAECLDKSSHDFRYKQCRQTQAVFDKCVLNHMGIERPPYNYYNIPQVHHTERPRPIEKGTPEFPDPSPRLPDDFQAPPAKFGSSRNFN